jgi:hypothetical protein
MMGCDRPYGEFYDFYSFSSEYFDYTIVFIAGCSSKGVAIKRSV